MSTDKYGTELTKRRPLPEWMYATPDGRNVEIARLQAEVMMLRAINGAARARAPKRRRK